MLHVTEDLNLDNEHSREENCEIFSQSITIALLLGFIDRFGKQSPGMTLQNVAYKVDVN